MNAPNQAMEPLSSFELLRSRSDGRVIELHAGYLFHVPPVPHDNWIIGDEPYVSLYFLGAEKYAKKT